MKLFALLSLSALALSTAAVQKHRLPVPSAVVDATNVHEEFATRTLFENFKSEHNKNYKHAEEEAHRFGVFRANLVRINELNSKSKKATFGVNKFADLTAEEFAQHRFGFKPIERNTEAHVNRINKEVIAPFKAAKNATSVDWRDKGAVTEVKDQGQCGSCWAFSAVEEVESATFLSTGTLPILSEQQVTSCDTVDGGCNGGDTPTAYDYIQENLLETEKDYPYKSGTTGSTGTCKFNKSLAKYGLSGWTYATPKCTDDSCDDQDEQGLANNIAGYGPASICVNANAFQLYSDGILTADECGGSGYYDLNHCVQITGFDLDDTTPYWWVRNSWGTSWGEDGYVRLEFGTNACGVADEATFVQV